jgi:hypothetical protein
MDGMLLRAAGVGFVVGVRRVTRARLLAQVSQPRPPGA